jgi:hypothetical protein
MLALYADVFVIVLLFKQSVSRQDATRRVCGVDCSSEPSRLLSGWTRYLGLLSAHDDAMSDQNAPCWKPSEEGWLLEEKADRRPEHKAAVRPERDHDGPVGLFGD